MPPRRRASRKHSNFWQEWGELSADEVSSQYKDSAPLVQDAAERISLEAEAVLFFLQRAGRGVFKDNICKWCKEPFMHTYSNVAFCTDNCRKLAMEHAGLDWNPHGRTDYERWGGKVRKVIGVEATERLQEWLVLNPGMAVEYDPPYESEIVPAILGAQEPEDEDAIAALLELYKTEED